MLTIISIVREWEEGQSPGSFTDLVPQPTGRNGTKNAPTWSWALISWSVKGDFEEYPKIGHLMIYTPL